MKYLVRLLAAIALGLIVPRASAAEPFLEKIDLFEAGQNGAAAYRIPGILVTSKGTALAYCEARKKTRNAWGDHEIQLRRSSDGGKTWDAPRRVGEPVPFERLSGGKDSLPVAHAATKP